MSSQMIETKRDDALVPYEDAPNSLGPVDMMSAVVAAGSIGALILSPWMLSQPLAVMSEESMALLPRITQVFLNYPWMVPAAALPLVGMLSTGMWGPKSIGRRQRRRLVHGATALSVGASIVMVWALMRPFLDPTLIGTTW